MVKLNMVFEVKSMKLNINCKQRKHISNFLFFAKTKTNNNNDSKQCRRKHISNSNSKQVNLF